MQTLILLGAVLAPSLLLLGILLGERLWRLRDRRRSPITHKVLNFPGEGLRRKIAKHEDRFYESAGLAICVGPIILAAWLLARLRNIDWSKLQFGVGDYLFPVVGLVILLWCAWRLIQHARARRRYFQALEAELAVGQSLSRLQTQGALVFHDFPVGKFNIDHIVIGRSVVFAVETKSRKKPPEKGKKSAEVLYDGEVLTYPSGIKERKPIEQASSQADWLSKFLASGVGEPVRVIGVLALPGWYTPPTGGRPSVLVNNCANPAFMMNDRFGAAMPESLRTRIAHVLTDRYPELQVDPLKA